ncbi:alpha/beta fold hydrolase [Amycolatopsis sp. YIM 10]|uniref:alpha/beta fold hydrolase n=1 Tax=Amycolatopsis sp. YIM 10 TaxID=2653857 RepID=UPI0012905BDA|nr:alpha/beta fold hydrolase [Amycolatopsis sp. YIM 10]QFU94719.1 3-oxoadipate enol-lactonase 2 [Amycolatopsis sp. YIM 10]
MSVRFTRNGNVEIAYETFGSAPGRPLLLIQGAGAPMLGWADEFCEALVERGFHVARCDNRDAGRSSRATRPYTVADMATDGLAVLDALGWPAAHVAGISLGGMIGQVMAARHPDRVLSLTSMCSAPDASVRRTKLGFLLRYFALNWRKPAGPDAAGERLVKLHRLLGSTGHPRDEEWLRRIGREGHAHRTDAAAGRRQAAAARASGDRRAELATITAPTLVLSGEADPVQPPRAGRATADAIPGARFVSHPGMGHDLPPALWPAIIDDIDKIASA